MLLISINMGDPLVVMLVGKWSSYGKVEQKTKRQDTNVGCSFIQSDYIYICKWTTIMNNRSYVSIYIRYVN